MFGHFKVTLEIKIILYSFIVVGSWKKQFYLFKSNTILWPTSTVGRLAFLARRK